MAYHARYVGLAFLTAQYMLGSPLNWDTGAGRSDEPCEVTIVSGYIENPVWSPDGQLVAYEAWDVNGYRQIRIVGLGGDGDRALTSGMNSHLFPQWSPDGIWIAYVKTHGEERRQICKVRLRGGNEVDLTNRSQTHISPQWSPDGAWLLYLRVLPADLLQLWKISADGSRRMRLTYPGYRQHMSVPYPVAVWSPDGQWIAVERVTSGTTDNIAVIASGGGKWRIVAGGKYDCCSPTWSPDSEWIAYRRDWQIWKSRASGEHEQALTSGRYRHGSPQWSPDGKWIAYHKERLGSWDSVEYVQICRVASTGGAPEALTPASGFRDEPLWAPDGRSILYTKSDGNGDDWQLCVLKLK